jgi:hypothetical protein
VLLGRGLCDELITCAEESYRLWCVVVCELENLKNEEAMTRFGSQRHSKKKNLSFVGQNVNYANCEDPGLLGADTVSLGERPTTFRRVLLPFSQRSSSPLTITRRGK